MSTVHESFECHLQIAENHRGCFPLRRKEPPQLFGEAHRIRSSESLAKEDALRRRSRRRRRDCKRCIAGVIRAGHSRLSPRDRRRPQPPGCEKVAHRTAARGRPIDGLLLSLVKRNVVIANVSSKAWRPMLLSATYAELSNGVCIRITTQVGLSSGE